MRLRLLISSDNLCVDLHGRPSAHQIAHCQFVNGWMEVVKFREELSMEGQPICFQSYNIGCGKATLKYILCIVDGVDKQRYPCRTSWFYPGDASRVTSM